MHVHYVFVNTKLSLLLGRMRRDVDKGNPRHYTVIHGTGNGSHLDCTHLHGQTQVKWGNYLWPTTNVDDELTLGLFVDLVNILLLKPYVSLLMSQWLP